MAKCQCGCGRSIPVKPGRRYADRKTCRSRALLNSADYGYLPIDHIVFKVCWNCEEEYLTHKWQPQRICPICKKRKRRERKFKYPEVRKSRSDCGNAEWQALGG